ncbi:MAG TPA: flagellar basal-body rod protein FlgG [Pirellulales bacterium]
MSIQALWTGATGMRAMEMRLDVTANNLANVNSIGFKRARANTEDMFYRQIKLPGAQDAFNNYAPTGVALGLGTRVQGTQTIFDQGAFEITNNPLDMAIDGQGFFQVIDPTTNNFLYTRAGNFGINSNGLLVVGSAQTGRLVQPQISLPIDTQGIVVSAEGNVSIQQFGQTQFSQIGQLQLAKFMNPEGLLKMGENLYQETLSSGAAIFGQPGTNGLGTLQQNALERSNVEPVNELIDLITTQRSFELNSQSVQAGDQMLQLVNNLRRF